MIDSRVLIVDDSAIARQAVSRAIAVTPGMSVAGLAHNGQMGLERVAELSPDAVVLDLEMPVMDGLTFLRRVRTTHPRLPVVVFSSISRRGADATLEAMNSGATAYVLKPSAVPGGAPTDTQTELIPVLQAVLRRPAGGSVPTLARASRTAVGAVVVAVSTGGPTALNELLPALPGDLAIPVLVVQHMPAEFTTLLAKRLDSRCAVKVVEATDGQPVTSATVYLAPGGRHMEVAGTPDAPRIRLTDDPPVNSCRPAADVLFESAARVAHSPLLAVVMTGMGNDGLRGARAVVAAGGSVIAQDPATAVVGSMPTAVIEGGLAYAVLPVPGIADEIVRRARGFRHP